MRVEESQVNTSRMTLALERFAEGHSFDLGRINFWLAGDNDSSPLEVRIRSAWAPENITNDRAREELDIAKGVFKNLIQERPDFARLIRASAVEYVLIHDYGSGMVELAREQNSRIVFATR